MAQSHTESSYRGLDVFWNGPTQQPPVSWEDWAQRFQLIVNAKKKIDIEDLLAENTLPPNDYKTLEEPQGTEKAQVRAAREAHNERALQACQTEETRRSEQEKRLFKGSTSREADKRLKSKLFLSFTELWKLATEVILKEPNVTSRRFILFGRK